MNGSSNQNWREVESRVHEPNLFGWLIFSLIPLFIGIGGWGFAPWQNMPWPANAGWLTIFAVFALLGLVASQAVARKLIWPEFVRHVPRDLLPNVPRDPLPVEDAMVHGRFTHKLTEHSKGWRFERDPGPWRNTKRFLFGFGVPFLVVFAGIMSWIIQSETKQSWVFCVLAGTFITAVTGGTTFLLIGLVMRGTYRQLSCLSIPRDNGPLELDSPVVPNPATADLSEAIESLLGADSEREKITIPREELVAVQLCPWYVVIRDGGDRTSGWAVQGLLVLELPDRNGYTRLPIMLTSDFNVAARLMRQLALTLQVRFLFSADAEDFKAERLRARTRPALRSGGTMTDNRSNQQR